MSAAPVTGAALKRCTDPPLSAAPVAGAALNGRAKTLAGLTKSGGASVVWARKTYTRLMLGEHTHRVGLT